MSIIHSIVADCPKVGFKRLRAGAALPAYQTDYAAGMDLAACPEDGRPVAIPPGEIRVIGTGLAMSLPMGEGGIGYEGQVRPRSGLACRFGVTVPNAPGTIDADYRGELKVALVNLGKTEFVVEPGMRIAQLVIAPVVRASIVERDDLDETRRGSGGFGSTGV